MRILYFGTGEFAEPAFQALLDAGTHQVVGLVTNPDRPSGKGKHLEMERGIKRIALARNVALFQPENVNTPESMERIKQFDAELFVVAAYGQFLSRDLLSVPRLGAINIHASLLPKYRGAAPINWAIYHGETETGITIFRITPQMDAGEMIAKATLPIEPIDTAGSLEEKLAPLGARLAVETVDRLAAGPVKGETQSPAMVSKAPKLEKEYGLIDWTKHAAQVERQIRAMQPWPTAYAYLHNAVLGSSLRLIVFRAVVLPETTNQPPGAVIRVSKDQLAIACGGGSMIGLLEVHPAGKKRQPIAEFLKGHRIDVGDRFGGETKG